MQEQFSGKVVVCRGPYGFIGSESTRPLNHSSDDLKTTKGIFYRKEDFPDAKKAGDWVQFGVTPDARRGDGCYRAVPIERVSIQLQILDRVIDNPSVQIRWCLSTQALKLIADNQESSWYLAIVTQPKRKPGEHSSRVRGTNLATWVGLKLIGEGRGFVDLYKEGDHDVVAYLVESNLSEANLRKRFSKFDDEDRIDVWQEVEQKNLASNAGNLRFTQGGYSTIDQVKGIAHETISLPSEVFAKPLSRRMVNWLGYFGINVPEDECSMRGRVLLACTIGVGMFTIWEAFKRLYMLLLGVLHLCLAGGSPLPLWRRAFTSSLSATISNASGKLEYEQLTRWEDKKMWVPPPDLDDTDLCCWLVLYRFG